MKYYVCPHHLDEVLFQEDTATTKLPAINSNPTQDKMNAINPWGLHMDLPEVAKCQQCNCHYYKSECKTRD